MMLVLTLALWLIPEKIVYTIVAWYCHPLNINPACHNAPESSTSTGKKTKRNWYEHYANQFTGIGLVTSSWDCKIHTNRTMKSIRPDIVIRDGKDKICIVVLSVPADSYIYIWRSWKNYQNTRTFESKSPKYGTWGQQQYQM